jgi:PBSX family phage terminase large subunit
MNLHPAQSSIASDTHRFRVVSCGRRFGKTTLAAYEMLGVALSKNDMRIAYYAPTLDDARTIMWSTLVKICESAITYKNESRLELKVRTVQGGESLIVLAGWESVQERGKGRGVANDFIVCDEVAFYRGFWEGWNEVLSPTLIDHKGSALFISTPKGFNHFYELFMLEQRDKSYKSFHFTSYDNPHTPVEELDREKENKPENAFAQEYMADFRKTEGLIYKDFDPQRHVFNDMGIIGEVVDKIAGLDFGFKNPAAIVEIWKDREGNFWVINEWYRREKTNDEIVEYAKTLDIRLWYPDPAEPDRIEEMKRAGLSVREVNKDVKKGIDTVQTLFKTGRLKVHHTCTNLLDELSMYVYKEKRTMDEPEEPMKENDHALDALRYALFMQNPLMNNRGVTRQYRSSSVVNSPSVQNTIQIKGGGLINKILNTKWIDKP